MNVKTPSKILILCGCIAAAVACTDQSKKVESPHAVDFHEAKAPIPKKANANQFTIKPGGATLKTTAVKNETTPVQGQFDIVVGSLLKSKNGFTGYVGADLTTFNTNLEVRDQNIQKAFFGITDASEMQIVKLTVESLTATTAPASVTGAQRHDLVGTISLLGASVEVSAQVDLQVSESEIQVYPVEIPLGFEVFGFQERVEALKTLCNHKSIGPIFTINFSGVFRKP